MIRVAILAAVSTPAQAKKDSLSRQIADARNLIKNSPGWVEVAVLEVPGHTRRKIRLAELADLMASKGIPAYQQLIQMMHDKAFDILICREAKRLGRSQTVVSEIVETVIVEMDAAIWSLNDGLVDKTNFRMFSAMAGYMAASDIDQLVKLQKAGMAARIARGLSRGKVPPSHKIQRNELGKAEKIILNPETTRLWADIADLLLSGVGFHFMEARLAALGHLDPKTNLPYKEGLIYHWLYLPTLWGHSYQGANKGGIWSFDENFPVPPQVTIYRDKFEPVYSGDLATSIKAELIRRRSIRGKMKPVTRYSFTGLLVCDECHRACRVNHAHGKGRTYYHCASRSNHRSQCTQTRLISAPSIQHYIDTLLRETLQDDDFSRLTPNNDRDSLAARLHQLTDEITSLNSQIDTLILDQSRARANVKTHYTRLINSASERLEALQRELTRTRANLKPSTHVAARTLAFANLKSMGLDAFWQQDPTAINQMLRQLLGEYRLMLRDGAIIALQSL